MKRDYDDKTQNKIIFDFKQLREWWGPCSEGDIAIAGYKRALRSHFPDIFPGSLLNELEDIAALEDIENDESILSAKQGD